jgi:hypothetical protein
MSKLLDFYLSNSTHSKGIEQTKIIDKILDFYFNFSYVECIETGTSYGGDDDNFGLYLAKFTKQYEGKMSSVDIDWERAEKSQNYISSLVEGLDYKSHTSDSIKYLSEYQGKPNLVHLDSKDLDLMNPLPSMLHHWIEFTTIKDKMPSGSIILVDDNFFKDTIVYWNILDPEKKLYDTIPIDITYEIMGKGALIYHAVKEKKVTDWELIGDHYNAGPNQKLIFLKK